MTAMPSAPATPSRARRAPAPGLRTLWRLGGAAARTLDALEQAEAAALALIRSPDETLERSPLLSEGAFAELVREIDLAGALGAHAPAVASDRSAAGAAARGSGSHPTEEIDRETLRRTSDGPPALAHRTRPPAAGRPGRAIAARPERSPSAPAGARSIADILAEATPLEGTVRDEEAPESWERRTRSPSLRRRAAGAPGGGDASGERRASPAPAARPLEALARRAGAPGAADTTVAVSDAAASAARLLVTASEQLGTRPAGEAALVPPIGAARSLAASMPSGGAIPERASAAPASLARLAAAVARVENRRRSAEPAGTAAPAMGPALPTAAEAAPGREPASGLRRLVALAAEPRSTTAPAARPATPTFQRDRAAASVDRAAGDADMEQRLERILRRQVRRHGIDLGRRPG